VNRIRWIFALGLLIGLLAGTITIGRVGTSVWAQNGTPTASGPEMLAADIVEQVGPAVVTVINEQTVQGFGQVQPVGSGTGFIIDDQGHVITNNHVVQGGQQFVVIFADGQKQDAKLIGADPVSDLAVVQVSGSLPGTVSLGDSDALRPGQPVLAIGSPLGTFTNTVTQGIVSATHRDFPGPGNYTNLIQHDAPINPGNSGGPLFNFSGQVVGVNTLGIPEENGQPVQGLFFAIPSNTVKVISQSLIQTGTVVYPYFGVSTVPVTPQITAQQNLTVDHGALVVDVGAGSPADQAGIKVGDVILAIDGQQIDPSNAFSKVLFSHKPGDTVTASIQRGSEQMDVQVTLGTRPTSGG
jgi:2-alkenal reductase